VARLAHKTVGRLSPARDNVVLIPSWYSGTHWEAEVGLVGPRRAISPEKQFIALTGLLGGALWAGTLIFNMVFLLSLKQALQLDPIFAGGFFRRPPLDGLKAFDAIYADWGFSEPSYRTEAFRPFGVRTDEELVQYFWESVFVHHDANNLLAMLWTNATCGGTSIGRSARSRRAPSSCPANMKAVSRPPTANLKRAASPARSV
jgi:hypothetical protein